MQAQESALVLYHDPETGMVLVPILIQIQIQIQTHIVSHDLEVYEDTYV